MTGAERRSAAGRVGAPLRAIARQPVYPLLIAAYFPLHLMAANLSLFPTADLLRPLAIAVAAALLALVGLAALLRDRHRAALWSALAVILVCFFGAIQTGFDAATRALVGAEYSGRYLIAGLLALFGAVGFLARPGPTFTKLANVAAAATLVLPALGLAREEVALRRAVAAVEADAEAQRLALFGAVRPGPARPSVVHLVLDGYARADVLREVYGFDNAAFLDALRQRGFAVAERATTPYSQTLLVMNSVLSARYVQEMLPNRPDDAEPFRQILSQRLQINHVMRTLSAMGYRTAATEVDYDPVRLDRVDRFFGMRGFALSNFEKAAYTQTAIAHLEWTVSGGWTGTSIRRTFARAPHRDLEPPFFLYLHLMGPHPPFDVDRDGRRVDAPHHQDMVDGNPRFRDDPALREAYRLGYVEKLRFVNGEALAYLDRVLAEVPDPKVVVLHGDHGGGMLLDHEDPAATCLKERFSPLLAVYASDGGLQRALPADLNLVNLYRLVFNHAFGAELPLLPARSFFARWSRPAELIPLSPRQIQEPCGPTGQLAGAQGPGRHVGR